MYKFCILLFGLILISCTKFGKNVTVKGFVLNPITGEGIPDVEVSLLKASGGLPGGFKAVKTVYTDANGCYELNKLGLSKYYVRAQAGDRYDLGWYLDGENVSNSTDLLSVKRGKTMRADYHTLDYGEIKIEVHNVNCQGPNDTLIYHRNYISFPDVTVFQPFTLTGCYSNTGAFAKVPSGDYSIEWTVIRNGVSQNYSHILTVPGNGQAQYVLNY